MPTNDERREVAARLREARANLENISMPRDFYQASFIYLDELAKALKNDGCIFNRLADLIEPEPICIANLTFTAEQQEEVFQRVMKEMQAKKPTLVLYENEAEVCPECGEPLPDYANFCHNCGAKVVEE